MRENVDEALRANEANLGSEFSAHDLPHFLTDVHR